MNYSVREIMPEPDLTAREHGVEHILARSYRIAESSAAK